VKVEFQGKAYLQKYTSIESVLNGISMPLIFQDESPYCSCCEGKGYPCIGDVTIIINVHSKDEIVDSQISALQKQLQTVRAENKMREECILYEISKSAGQHSF